MSKTSELNFSKNLNKEQLDINFSHLRFNSSLINLQKCPLQTIKCYLSRLHRFRFKLVTHKINPFLQIQEPLTPFSEVVKIILLDIYNSRTVHRLLSIKSSPSGPYRLHQI